MLPENYAEVASIFTLKKFEKKDLAGVVF